MLGKALMKLLAINSYQFRHSPMKLIIYIFFLLFSFFVSAKEEMGVPWNIDCDENNCFMQVVLPYQGPTEMEQGGMSVSFSLKKIYHMS